MFCFANGTPEITEEGTYTFVDDILSLTTSTGSTEKVTIFIASPSNTERVFNFYELPRINGMYSNPQSTDSNNLIGTWSIDLRNSGSGLYGAKVMIPNKKDMSITIQNSSTESTTYIGTYTISNGSIQFSYNQTCKTMRATLIGDSLYIEGERFIRQKSQNDSLNMKLSFWEREFVYEKSVFSMYICYLLFVSYWLFFLLHCFFC